MVQYGDGLVHSLRLAQWIGFEWAKPSFRIPDKSNKLKKP